MKRISDFVGKNMAWIVLIIAALALSFARYLFVDTDKMDQLSSDDRYVRNGTDDETI